MADGEQWCLIESDPGLLTDLIGKIGVKGVQCEELYAPSVDELSRLDPVYGLIFLFKYGGEKSAKEAPITHTVEDLFFAQQMVTNACATQALVNILMNVPGLDLGQELTDFKGFTATLPPDMKGMAIGQSEKIRQVHNSYAKQEIFSMEGPPKTDQDAFHFLAYVPHNGRLYELDGLNQGPVDHGAYTGDNWYSTAEKAVTDRIAKFGGDEIRFNLCALVKDRTALYTEQIEVEKSTAEPNTFKIQELEDKIAAEVEKRKMYATESVRRKHNYIPLILEAVRMMASRGKLGPVVEEAKTKQKARIEAQKAKQEAEGK